VRGHTHRADRGRSSEAHVPHPHHGAPHYYFPNVPSVATKQVSRCATCTVTRPLRVTQGPGLLQPLEAPSTPFIDLTQDFFSVEPGDSPEGYDKCLVTICRFPKFAIAVPCKKDTTAAELVRLWHRHVYPITGRPASTLTDRDPLFASAEWLSERSIQNARARDAEASRRQSPWRLGGAPRGVPSRTTTACTILPNKLRFFLAMIASAHVPDVHQRPRHVQAGHTRGARRPSACGRTGQDYTRWRPGSQVS